MALIQKASSLASRGMRPKVGGAPGRTPDLAEGDI
jgi:hypothetical protein